MRRRPAAPILTERSRRHQTRGWEGRGGVSHLSWGECSSPREAASVSAGTDHSEGRRPWTMWTTSRITPMRNKTQAICEATAATRPARSTGQQPHDQKDQRIVQHGAPPRWPSSVLLRELLHGVVDPRPRLLRRALPGLEGLVDPLSGLLRPDTSFSRGLPVPRSSIRAPRPPAGAPARGCTILRSLTQARAPHLRRLDDADPATLVSRRLPDRTYAALDPNMNRSYQLCAKQVDVKGGARASSGVRRLRRPVPAAIGCVSTRS